MAEGLWGRFMGLMGRPSLDPGAGLWLTGNGIHMMFMRFPIDAVFLGKPDPADGAGTRPVLSVHPRLRAWTGLVPLVRGADGVLELPVGTIERTGPRSATGWSRAVEGRCQRIGVLAGLMLVFRSSRGGRSPGT